MANVRDVLNGWLLYFYAMVVRRTCRFQVSGIENLRGFVDEGKAIIAAHWHGLTMMTTNCLFRELDAGDFVVLLPDDWRGGGLKLLVELMGATAFPMNLHEDQTMGMGRQLVKMVRMMQAGKSLFFTPDGPDGPAYEVKPGIDYLARKADIPILPIGAYARHSYKLPRWDMYVAPYPFSRISIHIGEPMYAPKDKKDAEAFKQELTNALHRVGMTAAANYYD